MAGKNHGTWTKVINGTLAQRVAHSPADAVAFSFDGWTEQREEPKAAKADDSDTAPRDTAPRASGAPATGDAKSSKSK